jgi:hypothetical protein
MSFASSSRRTNRRPRICLSSTGRITAEILRYVVLKSSGQSEQQSPVLLSSGRRACARFCGFAMRWGCGWAGCCRYVQAGINAWHVGNPNRLSRNCDSPQYVGNGALTEKLAGRPKIPGNPVPMDLRQTRSFVLLHYLNYHSANQEVYASFFNPFVAYSRRFGF